jgi:hypothetical protein
MQINMKKIITSTVFLLAVFLLAGCGAKDTTKTSTAPMQKQDNKPAEKPIANTQAIETPAPSGKVDDTIDAIINSADSEKAQAISDADDAKSAVDSSEESNNLNNSYDQNNL